MASFLTAEGHQAAYEYPLWFLFEENGVAIKRINLAYHNDAVVTQVAMASTQTPKAVPLFKRLLEAFK